MVVVEQEKSSPAGAIVAVVALVVIAILGYMAYQYFANGQQQSPTTNVNVTTPSVQVPTPDVTPTTGQ